MSMTPVSPTLFMQNCMKFPAPKNPEKRLENPALEKCKLNKMAYLRSHAAWHAICAWHLATELERGTVMKRICTHCHQPKANTFGISFCPSCNRYTMSEKPPRKRKFHIVDARLSPTRTESLEITMDLRGES